MITIGRAQTLWELGRKVLPEVVETLERVDSANLRSSWGRSSEDRWNGVFEKLPEADFSRDFLAQIATRSLVMPLEGVFWSDWGRPERLYKSLSRMRQEYPEWARSSDCASLQAVWNCWAS